MYFFQTIVSSFGFAMKNISACCEYYEQQSQQDVAKIWIDVVEIGQFSQRMGAQEIKVA